MPAVRNSSENDSKIHAEETMRKILVTGAAGFIGFHLSRRLLAEGNAVVGLDNLNPYYDVTLKKARLKLCTPASSGRSLTVLPFPSASTCVNVL
jgi:hypothetical protein